MTLSAALYLCAIGLSSIAAYYSIIGLAAIFAASFWPVVLMASVLEVSKLIVASWLYRNWSTAGAIIKVYLTGSVLILMCITSLGVYGFLSKAHVYQGLDTVKISHKMELLNSDILQHQDTSKRYETQLAQLDRAINQQLDANRSAQALNFRRQQEAERKEIRSRLDHIQTKLQSLEKEKTDLKIQTTMLDSKLGAIKSVAELFVDQQQVDVEKTVRWMIIAIVMVFDPLAVLMLIAANMSSHAKPDQLLAPDRDARSPVTTHSATPNTSAGAHNHGLIIPVDGNTTTAWQNYNGSLHVQTHQGWANLANHQPRMNFHSLRDLADEPNLGSHVIVNKQQVDLSMIEKHVASSLDKWLDKSVNVVKPPDIHMVKEMVQEILEKNPPGLDKDSTK